MSSHHLRPSRRPHHGHPAVEWNGTGLPPIGCKVRFSCPQRPNETVVGTVVDYHIRCEPGKPWSTHSVSLEVATDRMDYYVPVEQVQRWQASQEELWN